MMPIMIFLILLKIVKARAQMKVKLLQSMMKKIRANNKILAPSNI